MKQAMNSILSMHMYERSSGRVSERHFATGCKFGECPEGQGLRSEPHLQQATDGYGLMEFDDFLHIFPSFFTQWLVHGACSHLSVAVSFLDFCPQHHEQLCIKNLYITDKPLWSNLYKLKLHTEFSLKNNTLFLLIRRFPMEARNGKTRHELSVD